jgi:Tfp pilus assembly protein PilP
MRITALLALLAIALTPLAGEAQNAPVPEARPPVAPATAAAGPSGFVYQTGGRRDPFVDLLEVGAELQARRGEGAAGVTLSEVSITGVVQSHGVLIAMIQGPDKKTYLLHRGDKLADAVVTSVTSQGIIVLQDIADRVSGRRQREVTKLLRSLEGTKE